jgi:hypothetical protein
MAEQKYKPFPETEDELWSECIRMHTDICQAKKDIGYFCLSKFNWLKEHNYNIYKIAHACFFCQSCRIPESESYCNCSMCPGRKVDPDFDCMNPEYDYSKYDFKFVNKLIELNTKRKAAK